MDSLATKNPTAGRRSAWGRGMLALGLTVGALLVWVTQDASAQQSPNPPNAPERVFALTATDRLLRFDGDNPGRINSKDIRGLRNGESLVGIDFRPSSQTDGQQNALYGVGDRSYIYTINPATAVAERGPRITANDEPVALTGTSFGIDFNPTVDRLRIVSSSNQNLRVNVDNGELADFNATLPGTQPDGPLQYAAGDPNTGEDPDVTGVAYRNSQPSAFGGTNTELYDIDAFTDDMSEQNPPNDGTLNTVGSLRLDTRRLIGFDIVTRGSSPQGDRGFAALQRVRADGSSFYSINLDNGRATRIGVIGQGRAWVEGLAIPTGQR